MPEEVDLLRESCFVGRVCGVADKREPKKCRVPAIGSRHPVSERLEVVVDCSGRP